RKRTDFGGGKTMGRVWRVVRDDAKPEDLARLRREDLSRATVSRLCGTLLSADGWHRDTAFRLLLERPDLAAAGPLIAVAADAKTPPATVVQALRLLDAFGTLDDDALRHALKRAAA